MKKLKIIRRMIPVIAAFVIGRYGIPLMQPAEVIYIHNNDYIVVKNFPLTRKGKAEWWLNHKDWLKKEYNVDPVRNFIFFVDFDTGFKTEGTDVAPFWALFPDTDLFCFPELKLIANCIGKKTLFYVTEGRDENENGTGIFFYSDSGNFMYSRKEGVIDKGKTYIPKQ